MDVSAAKHVLNSLVVARKCQRASAIIVRLVSQRFEAVRREGQGVHCFTRTGIDAQNKSRKSNGPKSRVPLCCGLAFQRRYECPCRFWTNRYSPRVAEFKTFQQL